MSCFVIGRLHFYSDDNGQFDETEQVLSINCFLQQMVILLHSGADPRFLEVGFIFNIYLIFHRFPDVVSVSSRLVYLDTLKVKIELYLYLTTLYCFVWVGYLWFQ